MNLNEIKLSEPVKLYLESIGFKVYFEVPELQSVVDIVALNNSQIIAVELKTGYCKKAHKQAYKNCLFADKSYIALTNKPRPENILKCLRSNIGILLVKGTIVSILSKAIDNHPSIYFKKSVIESCERARDNNIAGLPCQKGIGPAIDVNKAVKEYRKLNPHATWKQIFSNVPNHYASPASMRQSLKQHRHFEYLKEKYKNRKCGECDRQKSSCPKGLRRKNTSKACINFIEKEMTKQVKDA